MSQSTRLHRKVDETRQTDLQLSEKKIDYSKRIREVKDGETEFRKKQRELIESIRRFKDFIIETDTKKTRALQKAEDERQDVHKLEKHASSLRAHLSHRQQVRDQLKRQLEQHVPYRAYLQHVLRIADDFSEEDELLRRYHILSDTNADLQRDAASVQQAMERTQLALSTLVKDKQNEILVKNSTLARLQKLLEDASRNTASYETEVEDIEFRSRDVVSRFGRIQMAIRNLHARVLFSRAVAKRARQYALGQQARKQPEGARAGAGKGAEQAPKMKTQRRKEQTAAQLVALLDQIGDRFIELRDIASSASSRPLLVYEEAAPPATPRGGIPEA